MGVDWVVCNVRCRDLSSDTWLVIASLKFADSPVPVREGQGAKGRVKE